LNIVRLRRRFVAALLGIALASTAFGLQARAASESRGAHLFVQAVAEKTIETLTGKTLSQFERETLFREILRENFDLKAIGPWVLGRYWRAASGPERDEYLALFEDFVVKTYASRFRKYSSERLAVSSATTRTPHLSIVHSKLVRPHGAPAILIDWRVRAANGDYKIVDVVIEGVSMSQTQRSEFRSIIRQHGGDVGGLLAVLRERTARADETVAQQ
jgi:phospholipid transport system substrate-binding protein